MSTDIWGAVPITSTAPPSPGSAPDSVIPRLLEPPSLMPADRGVDAAEVRGAATNPPAAPASPAQRPRERCPGGAGAPGAHAGVWGGGEVEAGGGQLEPLRRPEQKRRPAHRHDQRDHEAP